MPADKTIPIYDVSRDKGSLIGGFSVSLGPKMHEARFEKMKNGRTAYRDADTGQFTSSPLKQALNDVKNGVYSPEVNLNAPILSIGTNTQGQQDLVERHNLDLTNTSLGATGYYNANAGANVSLDSKGVDMSGTLGASTGINILESSGTTMLGDYGLTVDGPGVVGNGGIEIKMNSKTNSSRIYAKLEGKLIDLKATYSIPEICVFDNCISGKISPSIGLGVCAKAGIGIETYKTKPGGSLKIGASLGSGVMAGFAAEIEYNSKDKSFNWQDIDKKMIESSNVNIFFGPKL